MPPSYQLDNAAEIPSPAAVLFLDLVRQNLRQMLAIAGDPRRLRPHCKTHKLPQITELELALGITRHKCATLAEAEMLARAGVDDILLAYNIVGPNIRRLLEFRRQFPQVEICVTADHPRPLQQLSEAFAAANQQVAVMLDLDSGMQRTGIVPGPEAERLYALIARLPGLHCGGLHLYDGQNHQRSREERRAAVQSVWAAGSGLRDRLLRQGLPVPRIVAGGTGSFPLFAEMDDPALELSPGTVVLHDQGYLEMFPDLPFTPALLILTRVVSRPGPDKMTLDAGTKAVAADPPLGHRLFFPELPEAKQILHNEEHLVLETPQAERYQPGDALWAIPRHVCPTTALHQQVHVVRNAHWTECWRVTARDRQLTI